MGRHGVSARVDGRGTAVRQARRSLRAEDRAPDGDRDLPRRLGAVRAGADHGAADRLPGAPGGRRRRLDRDDDGRDRRRRPAARAGEVPGLLRRRLRRLDRDRPAARRLLRRPSLVALDLLHQPPGRRRCARGDRSRVPCPTQARAPPHRLSRRGAARERPLRDRVVHESRRHHVGVGFHPDDRPGGARRRAARRVRLRRTESGRADPAAHALPEPNIHASRAESGSSSASRSSVRSPTSRCSCRSSRATARRRPVSCSRR